MLEINRNPSPRDLKWFGLVLALFLGLVGLVVAWRTGSVRVGGGLALLGLALAAAYYAVPAWRRPMFVGWMYLAFPIGWTVSMLILVLAYYVVLAPIGIFMRLLGHDPLTRSLDRGATTYWVERDAAPDPGRYFRQW